MQYLGEIRMFGGNFAPTGWAFCDGSLLSISANQDRSFTHHSSLGGQNPFGQRTPFYNDKRRFYNDIFAFYNASTPFL